MPLIRTTPVDPPARTHVWISGFSARGFQPGGTPELTVEWAACHQVPDSDPAVFEVDETFEVSFTGAGAMALFAAHASAYGGMKVALYDILVSEGLEAGTVE